MVKFNARINPRIKSLEEALTLTVRDMATIATAVDVKFRTNEKRLFSTEGGSGGGRWVPLSPAYAKQKARRFPGRKILARRGGLRRSLTTKGSGHVAEGILKPRALVRVGTTNRLAMYHAEGRPPMPKRDPLQHTQAQVKGYTKIIRTYLMDEKIGRVRRAMSAWGHSRGGA